MKECYRQREREREKAKTNNAQINADNNDTITLKTNDRKRHSHKVQDASHETSQRPYSNSQQLANVQQGDKKM